MPNPRLAQIEVSFDYLLRAISGHPLSKVETDIPADAKVYTAGADYNRRIVILTVESASFAEVPDHASIPAFRATVTASVTEEAMLADLLSKRHEQWMADDRGVCSECGNPLGDHPCPA